jgi:hypothetical protein
MWQDNNQIVEQAVSPELSAGEKILWCGQARGGLQFNPINVMTLPIGVIWLLIGIIFGIILKRPSYVAQQSSFDQFTASLFLITCFLVALFCIFGVFFADMFWRKHTYYAVTNKRVMLVTKWFSSKVQSLALPQLPMKLTTKADGSGNIVFGSTGAGGFIWSRAGRIRIFTMPCSFAGIDDAQRVYDIILSAQLQLGKQQ